MKERGILFSGAMVRALLAGTKTQTRRVVAKQPRIVDVEPKHRPNTWGFWDGEWPEHGSVVACPYGVPGDRLWVRETWAPKTGDCGEGHEACVRYNATDEDKLRATESAIGRWRPGIHMPRWASRITLEVTEVRVQRLADISCADIRAEGLGCEAHDFAGGFCSSECPWLRAEFMKLWDSINGDRAPWSSNPWVWAVSLRRLP